MTTPTDQLNITGGITQALLDALNQVHSAVAAQLTNPDGSPSGTAVYMHLPVGKPIDPMDYSKAWTPMGGDSDASFDDAGAFAGATPPPAPAGTTPAGALAAVPAQPETQLEHSIKSAYMTARLVDDMLMITDKGIAKAWPQHTVSIEYFTALAGMQAEPVPPPAADVQAQIDAAQHLLYTFDDDGNMTGYTPKYTAYRHNQKAWTDAVSANAAAYAAAMADPVQGQAWPVTTRSTRPTSTRPTPTSMPWAARRSRRPSPRCARSAAAPAAALIEKAHKVYDAYSIGSPAPSATRCRGPTSTRARGGTTPTTTSVSSRSRPRRLSTPQAAVAVPAALATSSMPTVVLDVGQRGRQLLQLRRIRQCLAHRDQRRLRPERTVLGLAVVPGQELERDHHVRVLPRNHRASVAARRPVPHGRVVHGGAAQELHQRRDHRGPAKDDSKLLPMIPKGFLIVRNVEITADSFGEAGSKFEQAMNDATSHTDSSSNSYGGSAGWFGIGGSAQHSDSDDHGAFTQSSSTGNGWSYNKNAQGGTLSLMGSQIVGWIGEIQPASPKDDAPTLTKKKDDKKDEPAKTDDKPADQALGGPGQVPTGPMGGGQMPTGPIDVTGTPATTGANN